MENFAKKPSETEFLVKYSQAKSEDEKLRLKKEYEAEVEAYWNWMNKADKMKEDASNE